MYRGPRARDRKGEVREVGDHTRSVLSIQGGENSRKRVRCSRWSREAQGLTLSVPWTCL